MPDEKTKAILAKNKEIQDCERNKEFYTNQAAEAGRAGNSAKEREYLRKAYDMVKLAGILAEEMRQLTG